LAATWELNLAGLLQKVSAGFFSRAYEVPVTYNLDKARKVLSTIAANILEPAPSGLRGSDVEAALKTMYAANMGWLNGVEPLRGYLMPYKLRRRLEAFFASELERLLGAEGVDMTYAREFLDSLRICLADAVTRRFAGTEVKPGLVEVDEEAVETAMEYAAILLEQRASLYRQLKQLMKLQRLEEPMRMSDAYAVVKASGAKGITYADAVKVLVENHGYSESTAYRRLKALVEQGLVEEEPHPTDSRRKILRAKGFTVK